MTQEMKVALAKLGVSDHSILNDNYEMQSFLSCVGEFSILGRNALSGDGEAIREFKIVLSACVEIVLHNGWNCWTPYRTPYEEMTAAAVINSGCTLIKMLKEGIDLWPDPEAQNLLRHLGNPDSSFF